jgi:hypothetical protein
VRALTEKSIRRSFVNCSRGEATTMTLPRDLDDLPWDEHEYLGWRDPRRRCGLRRPVAGRPTARHRPASRRDRHLPPTAAMCLLCQTTHSGGDVTLFTARRAGQAGRNGNTVGQYICADLSARSASGPTSRRGCARGTPSR